MIPASNPALTAAIATDAPTIPGTLFGGGFFAGRFVLDGKAYALIKAPKAQGEIRAIWHPDWRKSIPGARSRIDGMANTLAMAEAGSPLAQQILALEINGLKDWYLDAVDELELSYRNLKPVTAPNWLYGNRGVNEHSVPPGKAHTKKLPAQTVAESFREGASEAFERAWYWSSTEFDPHYAWIQYFDDGYQNGVDVKDDALRCRAVRKVLI